MRIGWRCTPVDGRGLLWRGHLCWRFVSRTRFSPSRRRSAWRFGWGKGRIIAAVGRSCLWTAAPSSRRSCRRCIGQPCRACCVWGARGWRRGRTFGRRWRGRLSERLWGYEWCLWLEDRFWRGCAVGRCREEAHKSTPHLPAPARTRIDPSEDSCLGFWSQGEVAACSILEGYAGCIGCFHLPCLWCPTFTTFFRPIFGFFGIWWYCSFSLELECCRLTWKWQKLQWGCPCMSIFIQEPGIRICVPFNRESLLVVECRWYGCCFWLRNGV